MKKFITMVPLTLLLLLVIGGVAAYAQTSNVTFIVNTATVPDTLVPASDVRITGSAAAITGWGAGVALTNIGGDYWSTTVALNDGDTVYYKIKIGGGGWEQDLINPYGLGSNRAYIVDAHHDTTLPVQFWNNGPKQDQYFRPWTAVADTFLNVYFRVDLQGVIQAGSFNWNDAKDGDSVGVRGDGKGGPDLGWSPTFYLTREVAPTNSASAFNVPPGNFFSGRVRFRKSQVNPGLVVNYKYIIGADWGRDEYQGRPNRTFTIPSTLQDTTIQYVYYNDQKPNQRANHDTCLVTFRANMTTAIQGGGFSIGDTVVVRSGYFGTAMESGREKRLLRQGLSAFYQATDTVVTSIANSLDYQFYLRKNGVDTRENYYNFYYNGQVPAEAERRLIIAPSQTFIVLDTALSIANARRQPVFPNGRTLARNVNVRWEVDVRPAIYQVLKGDSLHDIQGSFSVLKADSVMAWGVWMNGLAVGGWGNTGTTDWDFGLRGNLDKKMYDDGTNGDLVAGDSIFTRMVLASPDSLGIGTKGAVGQVFKFGIGAGDNEGGKGGFGNNHLENIDDTGPAYTLLAQFGSINPAFYSAWDYDCHCPKSTLGVGDGKDLPRKFSLSQNYPNPFNPSTKINYSIPSPMVVTLKLYNLLGQEIATLVNSKQEPGQHVAVFDASRFGSGVYYYRITAGQFTDIKKMLLLK